MLCSVCSVVSSAVGSSLSPVGCASSRPTPARSSASVPPGFSGECSESSNVVLVSLVDRLRLQSAGALVGASSSHVGGGRSFSGDVSTFSTGALRSQVEGGGSVTTRLEEGKRWSPNLLPSRYTIKSGTLTDFATPTSSPSILGLGALWNPSQDLEVLAGLRPPAFRCTGLGVRSFPVSGLPFLGDNLAALRPPSFEGLERLLLFPGLVQPKTGLVLRVGTPRWRFTGLRATSSSGLFASPLTGLEEQIRRACPPPDVLRLWSCSAPSTP